MTYKNNNQSKYHCMVVHAHYPIGETRVEREALALLKANYQVDVICLRAKNEAAFSVEEGINVYRLPTSRRLGGGVFWQLIEYLIFFTLAFFKVAKLYAKHRYQVVQVHNLPDFLVFAALIPKLRGAKIILDIHDVMPEFYAARFKTNLNSWPVQLVTLQEQLSCRFADHVITVSSLWRDTLINRGVVAHKISVVMNVADSRLFFKLPPATAPVKNNSHFHLIYHGTLSPRYGLDLTIKAIHLVQSKIPTIKLTIHGGGELWQDELKQLMGLAEQLGIKEHVNFSTQFVPIAQLPDIIRQADGGIVSYRRDVFTDGILPTKVMEYIALGIPVIAARSPVMQAYFDDSMIQFFEPEDVEDMARAIETLYHNPSRINELLTGAEKFNHTYGWSKVSAAYVALVNTLGTPSTKQKNKQ